VVAASEGQKPEVFPLVAVVVVETCYMMAVVVMVIGIIHIWSL